jgi:hypothetical protein
VAHRHLELEHCREFTIILDQKNTGDDRAGRGPSQTANKESHAVLRVIDTASWIATGIVVAAIACGASTGNAEAKALKAVCAHEEDANEVVQGQPQSPPRLG